MKKRPWITAVAAALALLGATCAWAEDFSLDWYSVDAGGDMWTTGSDFELSGTVGQPEASAVMTGGEFELTGGFWAVTTAGGPAVCLGDLNCDGQVDFSDINPFVLYISNYPGWQSSYPGCDPLNGDINEDGTYGGTNSFADINPFVSLLTTNPLPIPCTVP